MIKKTVKFVDFNNVQREEDLYFNLTKAEVVQMELGAEGNSLTELIKNIVKAEKGKELLTLLDDFLRNSYGIKSADGLNFMKSDEIYAKFKSSGAYSEFFMMMLSKPEEMAAFFEGLISADNSNPDLSPSEQARQRSEAMMVGRRSAAVKDQGFTTQAEIPTVTAKDFQPVTDLTTAQLEAMLAEKRATEQ